MKTYEQTFLELENHERRWSYLAIIPTVTHFTAFLVFALLFLA